MPPNILWIMSDQHNANCMSCAGHPDVRTPNLTGFNLEQFVSTIPLEHNLETWTGNAALELLRNRDVSRPFMMHLSFQRPH